MDVRVVVQGQPYGPAHYLVNSHLADVHDYGRRVEYVYLVFVVGVQIYSFQDRYQPVHPLKRMHDGVRLLLEDGPAKQCIFKRHREQRKHLMQIFLVCLRDVRLRDLRDDPWPVDAQASVLLPVSQGNLVGKRSSAAVKGVRPLFVPTDR